MSTFVLVHGAWHGGWCWHKVAARLEKRGHRALAPDMLGHGRDRTPTNDLTLDNLVSGVATVVETQDEPVILVGHSFGGMIITQVAERLPERIKSLVYLTAFVVPGGKTMLDLNSPADPESLIPDNLVYAPDALSVTMKPESIRDCFYGDCSDDDVALARTLLVPEAAAAFATPSTATAARWGRIPGTYIECTKDRAIGIKRQRMFASLLDKPTVYSLDIDHSPFFSAPDKLVEILAA